MNYESILARANELYRASKGEASNYMPIEIRSDQVKSILQAIVEAINDYEEQQRLGRMAALAMPDIRI